MTNQIIQSFMENILSSEKERSCLLCTTR